MWLEQDDYEIYNVKCFFHWTPPTWFFGSQFDVWDHPKHFQSTMCSPQFFGFFFSIHFSHLNWFFILFLSFDYSHAFCKNQSLCVITVVHVQLLFAFLFVFFNPFCPLSKATSTNSLSHFPWFILFTFSCLFIKKMLQNAFLFTFFSWLIITNQIRESHACIVFIRHRHQTLSFCWNLKRNTNFKPDLFD